MKHKAYFLFSAIFTLMILVLINNHNNGMPTGFATFATSDQARANMNLLASGDAMQLLGAGAEICAVVEITNETTTYYFKITSAGVEEKYCADPGQDNMILKFNSYDDLLSARTDLKAFITEKQNTGYYIFPSNYVATGGDVQCTASFQQKYCAPFYLYMTSSEISQLGLACCANYELTAEQQAKIKELKANGKKGLLESPADFLFSTTGIIIVITVLVFIIILSSLLLAKPKNPLGEYVRTTRGQGYVDEDITRFLKESGWDDKTINDALKRK